jgi:hypothetical protein
MGAKNFMLGCACFWLSTAAVGQVYKWVDARGVTHYGDKPPAHQSTTRIIVPTEPPQADAHAKRERAAGQAGCSSSDCRKPDAMDAAKSPPSHAQQKTDVRKADQLTTATLDPTPKAIADCKANRGVDYDKPAEIQNWVRQNTPPTPEELAAQQRAGAANAARARIELEHFQRNR